MVNSMQKALIKKDIGYVTSDKSQFALYLVPLVFLVAIPIIFFLIFNFAPHVMQQILDILPMGRQFDAVDSYFVAYMLNSVMPVLFTMIPVMFASTMAASSFVGEKEKRTLETLLYCPLSLRQIYQAKVWASFLLSMIVTFVSFMIMLIVVIFGTRLTTGSVILPGLSWIFTVFLIAPAISVISIAFIVRGSAKAKTAEESFQGSVVFVLPLILIVIGQFAGVVMINMWYLMGAGVILCVTGAVMMRYCTGNFTYEVLLRRG